MWSHRTVLRFGPYRVLIFTEDHGPAHVHVIGNGNEFLVRLNCPLVGVSLRSRYGGTESEERKIAHILNENVVKLCEA
jgi:hypothetical protein